MAKLEYNQVMDDMAIKTTEVSVITLEKSWMNSVIRNIYLPELGT